MSTSGKTVMRYQPGPGQSFVFQGLNQGRFIYQRASRYVHDACARPHQFQRLRVNQVPILSGEIAGEDQKIAFAQHIF